MCIHPARSVCRGVSRHVPSRLTGRLLSSTARCSASSWVGASLGGIALAPSGSSLGEFAVDLGKRLLAGVLLIVGGLADKRLAKGVGQLLELADVVRDHARDLGLLELRLLV